MAKFSALKSSMLPMVLLTAGLASAAVHGIVKDDAGKPVEGILVVAEGTDLAGATDAQGKFELSTAALKRTPSLRSRLQAAQIQVDGLGRFQRVKGAFGRKLLVHTSKVQADPSKSQQSAFAARQGAVADEANLLVSGGGYFGGFAPVDLASSAMNNVTIESVALFAQNNATSTEKGDLSFLQFNDSIMQVVDVNSKENAVCKDGKAVIMPDTSTNLYKIVGKTMYLWDTDQAETEDYTATILSSGSGQKLGTWSFNGFSQPPVPLPDSIDMGQAELDSMLDLQNETIRYSGTATISSNKIHNDVTYGICMAPLMAAGFNQPPMVGTAKNCNDLELVNGDDTATWSFEIDNNVSKMTFTYQDSSCVSESSSSIEPMYDCTDIEDGMAPNDTSLVGDEPGGGLANCPAFFKFLTGGIDIPIDFPIGEIPGGLPVDTTGLGLGKKAMLRSLYASISAVRNHSSQAQSLEQAQKLEQAHKWQKQLPKWLR